jgi:hypothetical protein
MLGLTREQAEAYARSRGKRLPTDRELILATAPAKVQGLLKQALAGAKSPGAARPRAEDLKARLAQAAARAGEDLARSEGLEGWDGRPEWALAQRGGTQGEAAPWPRPPREVARRSGAALGPADTALRLAR